MRDVVTDHVGFHRSDEGLRHGLDKLSELGREESLLNASNIHGVVRAIESRNIRLCAELMTRAAIERTESRSGSAHKRVDYPLTEEMWRKFIVLRQGKEGDVQMRYYEPDVPLIVGARSLHETAA